MMTAVGNLLIVAATETNTDDDFAAFEARSEGGAVMDLEPNRRRVVAPGYVAPEELPTISGDRGLDHEEKLIFELGRDGVTGVDLPDAQIADARLGGMRRKGAIGLPGLSEPEVIRHYVRLSRMNYAIDAGLYPLGSCTMKHNPRLNEKMARLPGFGDLHPLAPRAATQGALELISATDELADHAHRHAGRGDVAQGGRPWRIVRPAGHPRRHRGAGRDPSAHPGAGIGPWHQSRHRRLCRLHRGRSARPSPTAMSMPRRSKAKLGPDVAAIMLTNPNTCGLFEGEVIEIAKAVHAAGAYFYCDGANFNAIAGRVRPGDLGIDAMHINLHKTFSTPHGGGGPGAGPVVLSAALAPFAPLPLLVADEDGFKLIEDRDELPAGAQPFGRMCAFHGQMGMFVRALSYMLSHGRDGVRQASEDAVLSANYILASLKDVMSAPFGEGPCMHEALFDDCFLEGTGVTTLDFAKAMIDEGYHPMTMYFPLVVHGAMLIEPTKVGIQGIAGPLHPCAARHWRWKPGPARPPASRRAAPGAPPPAGRNRRRAQAGAALEAGSR